MRKRTGYTAAVLVMVFVLTTGCAGNGSKHAYREEGIKALNEGNYESALEAFDKAMDSSGKLVGKFDKDVLKYRAEAEYLSGDYSAASDTYDILIKIDGERPEYYNMRAVSRAESGDLDGAIEDYKKGVQLDTQMNAPGRLEALLAAGTAMEKNGAQSDAMALYQEALSKGEQSAGVYNRMGLCSMAEEKWDEAIGYFEKGLSMSDASSVPELLFNQAVANEYKGEFKTALDLMEQYVSLQGSDEEAQREITFLKTR